MFLQVLQKEVETSERQGAKVIKALQEMSENYNRAETQRQQLDLQLQEALKWVEIMIHRAELCNSSILTYVM